MAEDSENKAPWLKPYHFKPGQSGNPGGRKTAGASIKERINQFVEADLSEYQLREIASDKTRGINERTAANRLITLLERGDIADAEEFLNGEKSLRDLRKEGVHTDTIKKAKVVKKTFKTEAGENVEVETREIEFHDRSGQEFDRISDRTEGRPVQAVDLSHTGIPTSVQIVTPLSTMENNGGSEEPPLGKEESHDPRL